MNCTNCGNPLSEGAKFCPVCGTPVIREAVPEPAAVSQPEAVAQPTVQPVQPELTAQPAQPEFAAQQPVQPEYAAQQPAQPVAAQPAQPAYFAQQGVAPQQFPQTGLPQAQMNPNMGFAPTGQEPAKPEEPAKKSKGFLKILIPVIALVVVGAIALTIFFVYTSRPEYKIKKALEKTFTPKGLLEAFDISDIVKDGKYTVDLDLSAGLGGDVDSYMGYDLTGSNKPSVKFRQVSNTPEGKQRCDIRLNLPFLNELSLDGIFYCDEEEMVISLPDILTDNLKFSLTETKEGYLTELLGEETFDSVRRALAETVNSSKNMDVYTDAVEDGIKALWKMLSETGYEELPEKELGDGDTGYMVTLSGDRIATFIDELIDIATGALTKTGAVDSIDEMLGSVYKSRKTYDDYCLDLSDRMHRMLDDSREEIEVYFVMKDGALVDFRLKGERQTYPSVQFIGKEGDYPLQNCIFLIDNYGIRLSGKTRTDGVEKINVDYVKRTSKKGVEVREELMNWTYNKDKKEFTINIADTESGDHESNIRYFDVDGISVKGTFDKESGAKIININKLALYDSDSETLVLQGTVKVSNDSKVSKVEGSSLDLNGAEEEDFKNLLEDINANLSAVTGQTFSLANSLGYGLIGGTNYNNYNYDYYDYDYYDDYYYDDYDYDDLYSQFSDFF